ncbi:Ras GTPase-activating-like protein IQGAP3 [Microtus ochrogaster]|uniref:Ras GTPase-activating-like protein IQGAP3 n=1 Tax=Microtus ochrogaster TaxID=79684 RepID=A0A8J6L044_MICOH|nr:Ras GTPase-activating-like protein IQGAP3 [Microtus ochrogaster]
MQNLENRLGGALRQFRQLEFRQEVKNERLTAEEMDEQRRQNVAYQYLCRLEEAKRWMEVCLKEELPSPVELEESLRNGVLLAKLGHCFAPSVVPLKKIYDVEQLRYQIFLPETTDVYDKKNMPRVIYCIHALSLFLFRLGLAPQIHDLYGKVEFTAEELSNIASELAKYGLQLPAFSKIGGILANEFSADEAAVQGALEVVDDALERQSPGALLEALQDPVLALQGVRRDLADWYLEQLSSDREQKSQELGLVRLLEKEEIQAGVAAANEKGDREQAMLQAVWRINRAIQREVASDTVKELMCPEAQLPQVYPFASAVYQQELAVLQKQQQGPVAVHTLGTDHSPASCLPYDVTPEQALSHSEVQRRLDISLRNLLAMTDKFFVAISSSVDHIPYGMRYMAKVLKTALEKKFPSATESEVYKASVVGNLLYYRFLNPAVVAPDAFDIVAMAAGSTMATPQRHALGAVAQLLQHAAAGKTFSGESQHLRVLNGYLEDMHLKFRKFIYRACQVPEPEERFSIDEYSDMVAVAKPVVYITVGELISTHRLLLEHQDQLAPDHQDPLHQLLEDLGEPPSISELMGENTATDGQVDQSRLEVSLTLTNKFEGLEADADHTSNQSLLLGTKQMLADLIQFHPGDSLEEILSSSAPREQEEAHHLLMCWRQARDTQKPESLRRHHSMMAHSLLPLADKQRRVLRNLRRLQGLGLVRASDCYQGLVDELAKDICNQRRQRQRRRAEILRLRATLKGLEAKTTFYEEQGDYYSQYIQACLDHLAPRANFRNVIFDIIPGDEAGRFAVNAKFLGVDMEQFQLHYQDLLQLQYEGVAVMKLFNKAKVNVNLLIFLLNKKFLRK